MTTEEVKTEKPAPPAEKKKEAVDGAKVESDKKDQPQEKKSNNKNKNRRVNQIKKEGGGGDGDSQQNRQPRKRLDTWNARDLKIIRALSGILKHGMWGFEPDEQGYLFLEDILQHKQFKETLGVKLDDLKRFGTVRKGRKYFLNVQNL